MAKKGELKYTYESLVISFNSIYDDKYTYPHFEYLGILQKIKIICPIHGMFEKSISKHLSSNQGCQKCSSKNTGRKKKTHNKYLKEIKDKSVICLEEYKGTHKNILHKCKTCGYEWKVRPAKILENKLCPNCAISGFHYDKPAILYYLKIKNKYYKIGITNNSVRKRFGVNKDIEIIKTWNFERGQDAFQKEQDILKKFHQFRCYNKTILEDGYTEIFSFDVLNEDLP